MEAVRDWSSRPVGRWGPGANPARRLFLHRCDVPVHVRVAISGPGSAVVESAVRLRPCPRRSGADPSCPALPSLTCTAPKPMNPAFLRGVSSLACAAVTSQLAEGLGLFKLLPSRRRSSTARSSSRISVPAVAAPVDEVPRRVLSGSSWPGCPESHRREQLFLIGGTVAARASPSSPSRSRWDRRGQRSQSPSCHQRRPPALVPTRRR